MFKSIYLVFLLYALLLIGFFLNADPNGGAFTDYQNHIFLLNDLKINLINTILDYDKYNTRHSPILYIFISFFYKLNFSDQLIRFISVHLCLLLPLIFYKSLLLKYKNINKNYILLFAGLVFLSPSFWSLSIWPDSRIFGLIFFCLSIFYFLKFENEDHFKNAVKCIFAYAIASYISPNFAVFSIYFFYFFYKKFNFSKKIFYIIIINIALSVPAIIYLFSLDTIFLFTTAVPSKSIENLDVLNMSNKILIISSLIFFYSIPFLLTKSIMINFKNLKLAIISIFITFILAINFNYNFDYTGGGIFYKISYYLFKNNILFFIICIFSLIFNLSLFNTDRKNLFLVILLILSNPQYTIYHKYYDPFLLILFTLIFNLNLNTKKLFNYKSVIIFYIYASLFLIFNFIK